MRTALVAAFLIALTLPAAAHQHRGHAGRHLSGSATESAPRARAAAPEAQIVAHPTGCPGTAFCGCGAAVEVFGRPIRDLWLAANWFRFPPATPAPGMVAVRQHHVFVIREVLGNGRVIAYDANSGHGKTQIHEVSLSGYSIRNPHRS